MRLRLTQTALLLALCLITACSPPMMGARRADAPIASTTRFEAARFAGPWVMRHAIDRTAPRNLSFEEGSGQIIGLRYVDGSGQRMALTSDGPHPARFTDARGRALWVLWVDDDYRTALLGAPDGRLAWIIDRRTAGGADRIDAALRHAAANGYDPNDFIALNP